MMDRSGAMSIPVAGLITAGTARTAGTAGITGLRGHDGRCQALPGTRAQHAGGGGGSRVPGTRMSRVVAARLEIATVLRPVRAGNAFEETVERLLTVIKLGVVGPGERFPSERDLAAQLGISRITLREAIRELQQAGFIESRRGRSGGTFVTYRPPTPSRDALRRIVREDADNLTDALTFRMAVETGAAQLLAQNAGPAGPASVRDVLQARLGDVIRASPDDYRRPGPASGAAVPAPGRSCAAPTRPWPGTWPGSRLAGPMRRPSPCSLPVPCRSGAAGPRPECGTSSPA